MLILSRKRNEQIYLGNNIIIQIAEVRGEKVRIGIVAPADIPVYRKEVYDSLSDMEKLAIPNLVPEKTP